MATVSVYDLENYPDNSKTITVLLKSIVPIGAEGDEKWVVSFDTTAYSNNTNRTAIQDMYVRDIKAGWLNSSGLVGTSGKFTINETSKTLGIKIDNSANTYYIELDEGTNITGDALAADMETKIRAIPASGQWNSVDDGFKLAYKNASVEFEHNKFKIIAGSMSKYYNGSSRTSVAVTASGSDTAYVKLGFDLAMSSEIMAGVTLKEALVTSSYTADTTPLSVGAGTGIAAGSAVYITDGSNYDYFTALSGTTDTSIVVPTSVNNNYVGIANSYTASVSKIQVLSFGDPESGPAPAYEDVDDVIRFGIKSMCNQIDFSS